MGMGGTGRAFGLHEAMTDIGSMSGPIIVAFILQASLGYGIAIGILVIPALLAIAVLSFTIRWFPEPMEFEVSAQKKKEKALKTKLPSLFWIYLIAAGLLAAMFIDYPLVAYNMSTRSYAAILDSHSLCGGHGF